MLSIERTEEGGLRMSDRRRSGVAAGEAEARRTLYHWGYTDLSINKALAEMRQAEGTEPPPAPWRIVRPAERAHETAAKPGRKTARARKASAAPAEPEPPVEPEPPTAAPKKRRAPRRQKAPPPDPAPPAAEEEKPAAEAAAPAPAPEKPARAPRKRSRKKEVEAPAPAASTQDALERARALFAEGARALREIEEGTLPFARSPWTDLRAQAEHIVDCLKG